jgi:hypothetical protein
MCKWTALICPGFWNHYNLAFLTSNSSSDHDHKKFQNFERRYTTVNFHFKDYVAAMLVLSMVVNHT